MVLYYGEFMPEIDLFKALADPQRRRLLDQLHVKDGQTLSDLCQHADMSRQAVSKHLLILETANLVTTQMSGRHKHHYLNPVPLEEISRRWLSKFKRHQARELINLRDKIEEDSHDN